MTTTTVQLLIKFDVNDESGEPIPKREVWGSFPSNRGRAEQSWASALTELLGSANFLCEVTDPDGTPRNVVFTPTQTATMQVTWDRETKMPSFDERDYISMPEDS